MYPPWRSDAHTFLMEIGHGLTSHASQRRCQASTRVSIGRVNLSSRSGPVASYLALCATGTSRWREPLAFVRLWRGPDICDDLAARCPAASLSPVVSARALHPEERWRAFGHGLDWRVAVPDSWRKSRCWPGRPASSSRRRRGRR